MSKNLPTNLCKEHPTFIHLLWKNKSVINDQ